MATHVVKVISFDPVTHTAEIVGDGIYEQSAGITYDKCDPDTGSSSGTPPIPGGSYLCTVTADGSYYVGRAIATPNLSPVPNTPTPGLPPPAEDLTSVRPISGAVTSRTGGSSATRSSEVVPGDSFTTTDTGGSFGFNELMFKAILNPALKLVLNVLNGIFELAATNFYLKTPGMEITSEVNASQGINTTLKFRDRMDRVGGMPSVEVSVGQEANLLLISVNGNPLLQVNQNRDVDLHVKNLYVEGQLITTKRVKQVQLP